MKCFVQIIRFLVFELFWTNSSVGEDEKRSDIRIIVPALFFLIISSALYGQGGVVHTRSFMHQNLTRTYLLYVSAAYTGQEDWPLVINYHGFSSNATNQMNIHSKMNAVADTGHFLVAYPQGLGVQHFNAGSFGFGWHVLGTSSASHDDVAFTDSLIDHVDADFNIDFARVHATGWSNGGDMAFYLACVLPDRIASIGSVSNAMNDTLLDSCQVARPFSTLLIHGTADPLFPFGGIPGRYSPTPTTPSFWASQNNCSTDSIVTELSDLVTTDNSTVTLIEYVDCDNNTEVLFYRVNNGGHAWPGTGPNILGNTNRDINASSEIWNFFKRNPHPDVTVGVASDSDSRPRTFQLHQNYPNPFNPTTLINYSFSSASHVELKIYNQLGQEIQTLVDANQSIGHHRVEWDGRDRNGNRMPSGLYLYRLKTGSFVETRKMILLR